MPVRTDGGSSELTHENDGRSAARSSPESIQDPGRKYITHQRNLHGLISHKSSSSALDQKNITIIIIIKHPVEANRGDVELQINLVLCAHTHVRTPNLNTII